MLGMLSQMEDQVIALASLEGSFSDRRLRFSLLIGISLIGKRGYRTHSSSFNSARPFFKVFLQAIEIIYANSNDILTNKGFSNGLYIGRLPYCTMFETYFFLDTMVGNGYSIRRESHPLLVLYVCGTKQ